MNDVKPLAGRLGVSGVLEFLDKDGNVLKTTEIKGSVPLNEEQAAEVIKELGKTDGSDDCK